jgi:hypothetical protein
MKRIALPRDAVIDRMMLSINGTSDINVARMGHLDRDRGARTLDVWKAAAGNPMSDDDMSESLKKSVSIATGLTYYDLRAPALNLFPTVTPLRNAVPRFQRPNPGDAAHWKSVLATTGSGFGYMGWVPEGQRSGSMSYTTANNSLSYATLGEEDDLTDEARFAAQGFEDEDALVQLRLLLKMFVKEEAAILGGNNSVALGTPNAPSLSATGSGATLPAQTYSVKVVALTQEGYLNSSVAAGVATSLNITGNDGKAYTLAGGSSNISAATTLGVTLGQTLTASLPATNNAPPVNGAVAYAWFIAINGSPEKLEAITTDAIVTFSAPLAGTHQSSAAVTADNSTNSVAFDGFLSTGFKAGNNAYVNAMTTGTTLTPSGVGGVNEIDTMLKTMWDTYRISPTVIYVNSQELKSITAKVLSNASAPLLRYNTQADAAGTVEYKLTAAGVVSFYFNPYSADGGVRIPIKIHPNLAAGTIFGHAERLPPWYVSNQTPEVAQVLTRQDYYAEVWPKTTRRQFYGIYAQEVLAVYAPFGIGLITNIHNG